MANEKHRRGLSQNLISMAGMIMAAIGFIAGTALIVVDAQNHFENPYTGIFTYMVIPVILGGGLLLILVGVLLERRRRLQHGGEVRKLPVINLNETRQFKSFTLVVIVTLLFIAISMVGSYRAYHFTESVEFCGITCHEVMKPEYTAYQNSPHANAACAKCHIGPGADFFVKSKINGLRQVYSVLFSKYSRPIPTPVHNLRPAKETCYECHWPEKFFGAVELKRTYFRADKKNSPWTIQMLLKVGGGGNDDGNAQGIHWHMAKNLKIEYIAADDRRQEIPWVRMTTPDGKQTVFQTEGSELTEEEIANAEIRTMDCIDCHNRPTHQYHSPEQSLNNAMARNQISADLPNIKATGIELLTDDYETEAQALDAIRKGMTEAYPDGGEQAAQASAAIQRIFSQNFFPEMKVSWQGYPDNIGHMITPGCFRCHNGDHKSEGQIITRDCNACHTIIAQGPGRQVESINTGGLPFKHPEDIDEDWKVSACNDCHEGVPVM